MAGLTVYGLYALMIDTIDWIDEEIRDGDNAHEQHFDLLEDIYKALDNYPEYIKQADLAEDR